MRRRPSITVVRAEDYESTFTTLATTVTGDTETETETLALDGPVGAPRAAPGRSCRLLSQATEFLDNEAVGVTTRGGFRFIEAACFAINIAMGNGWLSIPWAFVGSGAVLGPIILFGVAVVYLFSNFNLIESMARAEALTRHAESKALRKEVLASQELGRGRGQGDAADAPPVVLTGKLKKDQEALEETDPAYVLDSRKFEMSQLATIFLGPVGSWTFAVSFALYQYSALFSNAQVFGMAFAANIGPHISPSLAEACPNPSELGVGGACWIPYLVSVLAFAILAVLLTIAGLREQVWLQLLMTGFRILLALVMIVTVAADPTLSMFPDVPDAPPMLQDTLATGTISLAHFTAFLQVLPLCVYALNTSAVISSVLQETADRTKARSIFGSVIGFLAIIYCGVGLVISITFQANGKEVYANSSLLWNSYGGANAPWWALIIRYLVIFFPPVDVIAAFPLNAIGLRNNLASIYFHTAATTGCCKSRLGQGGKNDFDSDSDTTINTTSSNTKGEHSNTKKSQSQRHQHIDDDLGNKTFLCRLIFTLCTTLPPLALAAFVSDLGTVLEISGLFAFVWALCFPALYAFVSRRRCLSIWGYSRVKTPYSGCCSHSWAYMIVFILGAIMLITATLSVIGNLAGSPLLTEI